MVTELGSSPAALIDTVNNRITPAGSYYQTFSKNVSPPQVSASHPGIKFSILPVNSSTTLSKIILFFFSCNSTQG